MSKDIKYCVGCEPSGILRAATREADKLPLCEKCYKQWKNMQELIQLKS